MSSLSALGATGRRTRLVSVRVDSDRPAYSETGPIFVHLASCERYRGSDEFPVDFRKGRAIRGYDAAQNMIAGEVANGTEPETIIEKLLENPEIDFIQVRSASRVGSSAYENDGTSSA